MKPIRIVHLFPELLNLYGDGGNVIVLRKRCEWRGIPVEVEPVGMGQRLDLASADVVMLGGGTDREQRIVCEQLLGCRNEISAYAADGGVMLAVCGGYQLLGHSYAMGDETLPGLGVVDMETVRGEGRLIGNAAISSPICDAPIIGFENHGGRTNLGSGATPLGRVLAGSHGNNGADGTEGVLSGNVVGTYLHGPLLPKNPQVADWLLARALGRRGESADILHPLDDAAEQEANRVMRVRMGI